MTGRFETGTEGEGAKTLARRLLDALRYRPRPFLLWVRYEAAGQVKHRLWRRFFKLKVGDGPLKLHFGCGREALPGWVNLDIKPLSNVDLVVDARKGSPFADVARIYAEHFLEHLDLEAALAFLRESHESLAHGGWMRLSTPNLDWVWTHVYAPPGQDGAADDPEARSRQALRANRAFYGWRHRFLWNRPLLERALRATGFEEVRWCRHGDSLLPEFQGIERHETYEDTDELPHVLIVEARKGRGRRRDEREFRKVLREELLQFLDD